MSSESHNTRLGGMKQELHDFKNEFSTQLSDLSNSLNKKFDSLYKLLGESEGNITVNINDIVTESLMTVKDSIIDGLKAENLTLKSRVASMKKLLNSIFQEISWTNTRGGITLKFREFLQQCQTNILDTRCPIYVSQ